VSGQQHAPTVHIHLYTLYYLFICLFISSAVHFSRTLLVLLHRHFSSDLALSLILLALSQIVHTLILANLTLWHMSTIHSPFSSQLISNFSSILIVFCRCFNQLVLGHVDLHFSFMLVTKTQCSRRGNYMSCMLNHQHNQFMCGTDGMTVISLSANLYRR